LKIEQIMILITSIIAVFLTQQVGHPEWTKWACVFGMISQPFWIWSSVKAKQWGILGSSIMYTFIWGLGIYNNFFGGKI